MYMFVLFNIQLQVLFGSFYGEVVTMRHPNEQERREFFEDLILVQAAKAPVKKKRAGKFAVHQNSTSLPVLQEFLLS